MATRKDFAEEMGDDYANLGDRLGRAQEEGAVQMTAKEAVKLIKKAKKAAKKPSDAEAKARQRRMEMIRQGGPKKKMKKGGKTTCRGMGAALRGGKFREC